MTLLHDAYIAYLTKLTTNKNESEIWWIDESGDKVTVEPIDMEKEIYIVRAYIKDQFLCREKTYLGDKLNGIYKAYHTTGQLDFEVNYLDGKFEWSYRKYYTNGQIRYDHNYSCGERYGECKTFFEDGRIMFDHYYDHGKIL